MNRNDLNDALAAVGELLAAESADASIVVVGGASLSLLGLVTRITRDVDVIARLNNRTGDALLTHPEPLPKALLRAIHTVGRDFGLPADWMDTDVALQWKTGLPPGLVDDLTWRTYSSLRVGLAGRQTLIALKLFAAVDGGPLGVHFQDLVALASSGEDLSRAALWVRSQDTSAVFQQMVGEGVDAVQGPNSE
ncbi:MAG: hypothetical protein RhofKO_19540 [Rhodothermales bacterium]